MFQILTASFLTVAVMSFSWPSWLRFWDRGKVDGVVLPQEWEANGYKIRRITDKGGRVAWYKGSKHELVAFDAVVNAKTQNTEVFVMNPDGTGRRCVTCNSPIRKGFVGQPEWHPDGEHLLVQAENENAQHTRYTHLSWGINNDLWLIKLDGTEAEKIWSTPKNNAALHPHFSADGRKLLFAERIATGKSYFSLRKVSPGGENPWDGWQIHAADFDPSKKGSQKLSNHKTYKPNGPGFYETHAFSEDGQKIWYSHTSAGLPYVDDSYVMNLNGTGSRNQTGSPTTWEEHGSFSPSGKSYMFISSRADKTWKVPKSKADTVRTELFLKNQNGNIEQLTNFNERAGTRQKRYLTSDFEWDKNGGRVVFEVASVVGKAGLPASVEIWMITFPNPR